MGSCMSPVLAELVLEYLEDAVIPSLQSPPLFYYRYVDDVIMASQKNQVSNIVESFNDFHENLRFTVEIQKNGKTPFLDTEIIRQETGNLIFNWYRKPTWSGRYLNFNSMLPYSYKINTISILSEKIIKLSHPNFHLDNFNFLTKILQGNNYPPALIKNTIHKTIQKINNPITQHQDKKFISIPYKEGLFEKLKICLQKWDINLVGTGGNELSKHINNNIKDRVPKNLESEIIYKLECSCNKVYIGETNQYINKRFYQHKYNIKIDNRSHSGVSEHLINNPNHIIDFDNVKILEKEPNNTKRKIKECMYISNYPNNMNNHLHIKQLDNIYIPLIRRLH